MPARRKISQRQTELLLEFVESHPEIALGRFPSGPLSSQLTRQSWESLAHKLNAIADGVSKNSNQWRRHWIEWKAKIKAKAADSRRSASATGGGPSKLIPLTMYEERVLALIGPVAVEGLPGVRIPIDLPSRSGDPSTSSMALNTDLSTPNPETNPLDLIMVEEWLEDIPINPPSIASIPISEEPSQSEVVPKEQAQVEVTTRGSSSRHQSTPHSTRGVHTSHSARRSLRQICRDEGVPHWAYELELRRLGVEERHAAALERIAEALVSTVGILNNGRPAGPQDDIHIP